MKHFDNFLKYLGKHYVVNGTTYELQSIRPISRDAVLTNGEVWITVPYKEFDFDNYVEVDKNGED